MKRLLIILIAGLGFCQVGWYIETVDSIIVPGSILDFGINSLALDGYDIPHILYNKDGLTKIIYASKVDTVWQKEIVENGLLYAHFSLIFDADNNPHLSYYRKDSVLDMTYLCHTQRDTTGWIVDVVDSIYGILTNSWLQWDYFTTSLALDTADLPGIAYTVWNLSDSLFYIKYAHFNGSDWDTSIVEYDSAWGPHTYPFVWSPVLGFNSENAPVIAFHQSYSSNLDTIKIAVFDDGLNEWIIEPAICNPNAGVPISLVLDSQDYPRIAHGWGASVAYSWWDGLTWHTELTGASMGWIGIRIELDLDGLDSPHIMYQADPTVGYACYSYKRQGIWHNCGPIDPDSDLYNLGDISLALDTNGEPHVCCQFIIPGSGWNLHGLKYAKGALLGIKEDNRIQDPGSQQLEIRPNPFSSETSISYQLPSDCRISLEIYDITGRLVRTLVKKDQKAGHYVVNWDGKDSFGDELPEGIYFLRLEALNSSLTRKIVKFQ